MYAVLAMGPFTQDKASHNEIDETQPLTMKRLENREQGGLGT